MKNIYILKEGKEISSFCYGENKSIYLQKITGTQIIKNKILENCSNNFSVSLNNKGQIYILAQALNDNIVLGVLENTNSEIKLFNILKKDSNISNLTFFNPLFFENNVSLIFNSSISGNAKNNFLSVKTFLNGKQWTEAENIDIFSVAGNNTYEIQKLNEKDAILVYEKREKEVQLGFKEIINGKISPFVQIHKTGYQLVDFSFLATENEIHFIYILKNLFSSQVIYKRKDRYGVSAPSILYEGQKLRDCSVALINNELYCMYIGGSSLLYNISKDLGNSFSNTLSYKKSIPQDIVKAKFISNTAEKNIILNEVYTDYKNPINIQFIPEIYPDYITLNKENTVFSNSSTNFISDLSNQNISYKENLPLEIQKIENKNVLPNVNRMYKTTNSEKDFMEHFNPEIFETMLKNKNTPNNFENNTFFKPENLPPENEQEFIKNKLKIANEQIKEKDEQLIKLNNKIQEKQKEKLEMELDLRKKIKKLEEENKTLKSNIESEETNVSENKEDMEEKEDKNN